jgi:hypothetical protein
MASVKGQGSEIIFLRSFLFIVSFGYLFKFFEINYFINNNIFIGDSLPEWQFINSYALDSSFFITAVFLLIFAAILIFAHRTSPKISTSSVYDISPKLYLFITLIMVIFLLIRVQYGAVMGRESANLPWYAGTLLYRTQTDLMPGLYVLMMYAFYMSNQRPMYYLTMATLFILQLLIAVLSGSKSGVIFFIFVMICYWEIIGYKHYRKLKILLPLVILAMAAFVIGSQVRSIALLGTNSQYIVDLMDGRLLYLLIDVSTAIANRFPGQEALALACLHGCDPQFFDGVLPAERFLSGDIAAYYTRDVVGVTSLTDFRSPGFLGGAVMATGIYQGIGVSIIAIWAAVQLLRRMDIHNWSVPAKVVAIFGLFRFFMEGAWYWADLVSVGYGVIATEIVARLVMRRDRFYPQYEEQKTMSPAG